MILARRMAHIELRVKASGLMQGYTICGLVRNLSILTFKAGAILAIAAECESMS